MLRHAELRPELRVLDIGCGTGHPAVQMASQYGCAVLGISTSPVCIERANDRSTRAGLGNLVHFEVRDWMDTKLESRSFDRIWVMESSHLMPRKDLLLLETARLLRPGGKLTLCDIMLRRPVPFSQVLQLRDQLLTLDAVFGKATMQELSTYAHLARKAGYEVTSQLDISAEVFPTFARWRENAETYRAEVQDLIGPEALRQFCEATSILSRFWKDGWLGYGLLVAESKP